MDSKKLDSKRGDLLRLFARIAAEEFPLILSN
jgi:hypothetical protein